MSRFGIFLLFVIFDATQSGWVDPDTPTDVKSMTAFTKGDDREFAIVSLATHLVSFIRGPATMFYLF